jgi:hypothetical protein
MRWRRGRLEAEALRVRVLVSALWLLVTVLVTLAAVASPALADAGGSSVAYQLDPSHDGYAFRG